MVDPISQDPIHNDGALVHTEITATGIATITLNRPEQHNALNIALMQALCEQMQALSNHPAVRLVVLKGNGRSFCAGGDLQWMQSSINYTAEQNQQDAMQLGHCLLALYRCSHPVIAVAHGAVYGGGIGLLACCDLVVACEKTRFCFSEAKLGLIPAMISPFVLQKISHQQARRYFLTAEVFTAAHAHAAGLVDTLASDTQLQSKLDELTQQLLQNGPQAMRKTKQLLRSQLDAIDEAYLQTFAAHLAEIRASNEGQDGLRAFLEGGLPSWRQK